MTSDQRESMAEARRIKLQDRYDDSRFLRHHAKSVDLIKHNHEQGMSRASMEKIWPYRLLNLVIGHAMERTR